MLIDSILASKGNKVFTVSSTATVMELVTVLAQNNIGAVVVLDEEGKVTGIMSERDIVRLLARSGDDLLQREVGDLMTRAPISCRKSDTVDEIMNKMTAHRFRHLPVVEDDRLVGIVSIGDMVKSKVEEAEQEAGALREYIAS